MLELVAGILFAAAAVAYVLKPILGTPADERGSVGSALDEGDDPNDDFSPRAVALRALKEIEFDRATGKLSDADYAMLERQYTAEALAALRAAEPSRPAPAAIDAGQAAHQDLGREPRGGSCPAHGPRPEEDAAFCSECGRRLMSAPGFCARCGAALERDARYCHGCGSRVAA